MSDLSQEQATIAFDNVKAACFNARGNAAKEIARITWDASGLLDYTNDSIVVTNTDERIYIGKEYANAVEIEIIYLFNND